MRFPTNMPAGRATVANTGNWYAPGPTSVNRMKMGPRDPKKNNEAKGNAITWTFILLVAGVLFGLIVR